MQVFKHLDIAQILLFAVPTNAKLYIKICLPPALRLPPIPYILLHGHGGKKAEGKRHAVKPFFAEGETGIPKADDEQEDGQQGAKPTEAVVDIGNGDAFQLIPDGFLQGYGGKEAKHQYGKIIALFVQLHNGIEQANVKSYDTGGQSYP
jgi:hypothetical protein